MLPEKLGSAIKELPKHATNHRDNVAAWAITKDLFAALKQPTLTKA